MSIKDSFIAELKNESASTRKMLERVPLDKGDWKPHEKSMTLDYLTFHIADLPSWITETMTTDELDFAGTEYSTKKFESTEELLKFFDDKISDAIKALENSPDEKFLSNWKLRNGETIYFDMPRTQVLRGFCYNHSYHHRAQLSVYLRMLDVPLPSVYGPTADEPDM